MGLLTPDVFEVTIPSSGRVVKMRPFIVKEYKALMIAKEGGDKDLAVQTCLNNCIVDDDIKITELSVFDAEYLFLQLYMSSTGNTKIPIKYKCTNIVDEDTGQRCNSYVDSAIDIQTAWVPKPTTDNVFKVNNKLSIKLRYPSLREVTSVDIKTTEGMFKTIINCIDQVYTESETWTVEELGEQINDVLEMMPGSVLLEMNQFMSKLPRVTAVVNVKCKSCGHEDLLTIQGLDDFFV